MHIKVYFGHLFTSFHLPLQKLKIFVVFKKMRLQYIYIYICLCVCGYVCIRIHIHQHNHIYVYIYIYIYMHGERVDFSISDKMIKICGKMDKATKDLTILIFRSLLKKDFEKNIFSQKNNNKKPRNIKIAESVVGLSTFQLIFITPLHIYIHSITATNIYRHSYTHTYNIMAEGFHFIYLAFRFS